MVAWLDLGGNNGLDLAPPSAAGHDLMPTGRRDGSIFSLQISTRMAARGAKMSLLSLAPEAMGKGPIWAR